jgi:GNAT superfamily N-acetyltransferase
MNPLEKAAKTHFGVTDDLSETGYILSDGTFLDFSGRHEANGYVRKGDRFVIKRGEDYLRYHRYVDHRMLPESITDKLGKYDESHASSVMLAFMQATGAMRIMSGVGFAVTRMPTFEAIDAFMRGWKQAYQSDPVIVDILHPDSYTKEDDVEIDDPDVEKIIEFLESYFNSPSMGAISQSKQHFLVDGVQIAFSPPTKTSPVGGFGAWIPGIDADFDGILGSAEAIANEMVEAGRFMVAAACIRSDGRDAAWLESLKVAPELRGKGVGSRILKAVLSVLRDQGIGQLWLAASPEDDEHREALLRLYRRHGFDLVPDACRDRWYKPGYGEVMKDIMAASLK